MFDSLNDPGAIGATKFDVTGWSRFKLDKQLVLFVDGKEFTADRLRVSRNASRTQPMAAVEYRWAGDKTTHSTRLKGKSTPKVLDGLADNRQWVVVLRHDSVV